ncbi:hypothetical protein [Bounagaea algeriensis]
MTSRQALAFVAAQAPQPPEDPGGQGEDFGKSSPVGLLLLVLLMIGMCLLVWSMSRHLRRLPERFDEEKAAAAAPARARAGAQAGSTASGSTAGHGAASGAAEEGPGGEQAGDERPGG